MMQRWARFTTRYALAILLVAITITGWALSQLVDMQTGALLLKVDPSINRLLGNNDPERQFYDKYRRLFGADDVAVIAIDNIDVREPAVLARLETIQNELRQVPGIYKVASLASVPIAATEGDELFVQRLADFESANEIEGVLAQNPLFNEVLFSADYKTAAILISFKDVDDDRFLKDGYTDKLRVSATKAFADYQGAQVWVSGVPVIKAATASAVLRQFRWSLPVILGLVGLFLLVAFHSFRGVIMPMLTILMSLVWTLGILAAMSVPLNLITSLVPPVIITLGLAYSMHMMSAYFRPLREDAEGQVSIPLRLEVTMLRSGLPMLLTGLTTAAGFLALYASNLSAIREFALISALGVFCTVLLVLTFLPASMCFWPNPKLRLLPGNRAFIWLANFLGGLVLRYRPLIITTGVLILIACIAAATQIKSGTHYVESFGPDTEVRKAFDVVNTKLAGANNLSIIIEGYEADRFVEPEKLRAVEELQVWLDQQPEIGKAVSLVDLIKLLNRDLSGDPTKYILPDSQATIKQLLVFGAGSQAETLVDQSFKTLNIHVQSDVAHSGTIGELVARIEQRLEQLPKPLNATVTGNAVLASRTVADLAEGQLSSIALAMLAVYIVLMALFSSWRIALLALLPNLLPVAVYFGVLSISGVGLNPTTSLIACIVLGIAVDDTIHFLVRFNQDARTLASEREAVISALRHIIRPITFTSLALFLGFLFLTTSELQNQVRFGALAAFTMAIAWIVDVIFPPALGSTMRIVTLWDTLRVDLGQAPQDTIPLLNGLTQRQARTFALLTHLETAESGERLIQRGDDARDMYVVVEGRLDVWVEGDDGRRQDLNTMQRGAVLGEVGSFGQKRSANVDAATESRVLRFNDDDLERLRRSHPRIAATLYRNLNRIQAERLARTTKQLQA